MKRWKVLFHSFYAKLILLFLGVGLVPLILMGLFIYNTYSATLYENVLSNYSQRTDLLADNVADFVQELSDATERIYHLDMMDYDYFYELFEDPDLPAAARQTMILNTMRTILYMNEAIEHVIFLAADGNQYICMRPPERMVNSESMETWHRTHFQPDQRAALLIPTHPASYILNRDGNFLSMSRNIMNTSTIQTAGSESLGTLYLDVRLEAVEELIEQAAYGEGHEVYLVNAETGAYVYTPQGVYGGYSAYEDGTIPEEVQSAGAQALAAETIKIGRKYYICSPAGDTGWMLFDRIDADVIDGSYRMIRNNTFLLMFTAGIVLLAVYAVSSKRLDRPVRELKQAMGRIETGDLEVRVAIESNDEMEDIGKGLNQMVENLNAYIQKAYVAEIRQRDAKMEALITQIQPHYLYNTLDVIRMSAITADDTVVADMISSLSAQLKYVIGASGKMVRLEEEITCIRNYFRLLEVRYEYLYTLQIDVESALLNCMVPHLIIQPAVENAVKHGLRPKKGAGEVVLSARKKENFLELTVMDSGVGMTRMRLQEVQERLLGGEQTGQETMAGMSIGIQNVSERIRLLYGEPYRLEIESYEGIGTIVKYWLPLFLREECSAQEEQQDVSSDYCG